MVRAGITFLLTLFTLFSAPGEALEAADFPPLVSSLRVKGPLHFCGERVPIEKQDIRERLEKELLLALWDRPQVFLWLKRSRRYLPIMDELLKKNGLPRDLKYAAVAESALRPHVGSPKGAIGFWQFTRETGQRYGLQINDRIDERRNIYASTGAAVKYFKELHGMFHSWTLAAAAFNMGEQGLMSEMMLQGVQDYYRLYLPLETQRYIFRILSAKMIFSDPEKYGFNMSDRDYYPRLSVDRVTVECRRETPIRLVAEAAKTDFKVIKDLNPEIRGYFLAPGSYKLLIPKGRAKDFAADFEKYQKMAQKTQDRRIHVVQEGDNLTTIAEKYNIPLPALLIQNRLDPSKPIHPGDRLMIPPATLDGK